jgi:hypothetical protein
MNAITSPRVTSRLWLGAYFVAAFGTGWLFKAGIVPGWRGVALFAASFLLLIPLVRSVERAQAAGGCASAAMRIYNRRMIVASLTYVAVLLAGAGLAAYLAPPAPVRVLLAIIVALPVLLMVRAMALLLRDETDEYLRMRVVEQTLIATGFLLVAASLYGFLNAFDVAPRLDAYLVVPVWAVGLGIGRLFQRDSSC